MQNTKWYGHVAIAVLIDTFSNLPIHRAETKLIDRRSKRNQCWARVIFLPILILGLIALFANARLNAQANAGITGRVTDPSGAVIPGAHIMFTNEATGIKGSSPHPRRACIRRPCRPGPMILRWKWQDFKGSNRSMSLSKLAPRRPTISG